jgi:hypothetical protein
MARFNLHSVGCALLSDHLAQRCPVDYAEGAFAAGLFHDLGYLLVAVGLHEEFGEIHRLYAERFGTLTECETAVMGATHAEFSAAALSTWNLPKTIENAVRFHHEPHLDQAAPPRGGAVLSLVVNCADAYLTKVGLSAVPEDPEQPTIDEPFAPLGLALADACFLQEFDSELDLLSRTFQ